VLLLKWIFDVANLELILLGFHSVLTSLFLPGCHQPFLESPFPEEEAALAVLAVTSEVFMHLYR
jgi:hypothetical protein